MMRKPSRTPGNRLVCCKPYRTTPLCRSRSDDWNRGGCGLHNGEEGLDMRITFQSQGGIAFFPGLNRPVVIDTAQLPAEERSKLEGLLQSTRFFALPASVGQTRRGAADVR